MASRNRNPESAEQLDLVGTFEAHLILGVERSRIARFLHENAAGKDKIPEPVAKPECGPIWHRQQLIARAGRMYDEAGQPYGADDAGRDRWIMERARKRADKLPNQLSDAELAGVLGQTARELAAV